MPFFELGARTVQTDRQTTYYKYMTISFKETCKPGLEKPHLKKKPNPVCFVQLNQDFFKAQLNAFGGFHNL